MTDHDRSRFSFDSSNCTIGVLFQNHFPGFNYFSVNKIDLSEPMNPLTKRFFGFIEIGRGYDLLNSP